MAARTYNFDGIVGPTHGYGGLSQGNLASMRHRGAPANPRAAALQGLDKMRRVHDLGGRQAVLPPQPRPDVRWLRRLGFTGSDEAVLRRCMHVAPELLRLASSASAMWTANAATVAPSSDTEDGRVHLTVANLATMAHRSLEPPTTLRVLRRVFASAEHFVVHEPLPAVPDLFDEGAANHTRLTTSQGRVHLFAWGRAATGPDPQLRFPARQGELASHALARLHLLRPEETLFWQQSPTGIDAGAFHTDVLAVGEGAFFMMHEAAFVEPAALLEALAAQLGPELQVVVASSAELPLTAAVAAYPFNSELVERGDGSLVLLAPQEAWESDASRAFLQRVVAEGGPVTDVEAIDVNASMSNGGGPACLRLRVLLTEPEASALGAHVLYDPALDLRLRAWVQRHYRDRLALEDLSDPQLLTEVHTALDELSELLGLGSIYEFQAGGDPPRES